MDRKGKQKLKRYFIVYVIFAVFFTVGMYLITKYEENAKATQIALLLAEHPELEGEIVAIWEKSGTVDFIRDRDDQKIERVVQMLEETYGYHSGSGSSDVVIRIIWGIGLLVGVIVCGLFFATLSSDEFKKTAAAKKNLCGCRSNWRLEAKKSPVVPGK